MISSRPVLRRRPPSISAAIQSLLSERGEISRDDLRDWARERRLVAHDDLGAKHLKDNLFRLRARGLVDYDRDKVWVGRNPDRAGKLSRKIDIEMRMPESTRKRLIQQLIQLVSSESTRSALGEMRHGPLAR